MHTHKNVPRNPLKSLLKALQRLLFVYATKFKILNDTSGSYLPLQAHLNPDALVLCVPATLTFSEFLSGTFSLSSQEKWLRIAVTFLFLPSPWLPNVMYQISTEMSLSKHTERLVSGGVRFIGRCYGKFWWRNLNVLGLVKTKKNEFSEDRVDTEKNRQAKKNSSPFSKP